MPSPYGAGELANTILKCAEVPSTSWKALVWLVLGCESGAEGDGFGQQRKSSCEMVCSKMVIAEKKQSEVLVILKNMVVKWWFFSIR